MAINNHVVIDYINLRRKYGMLISPLPPNVVSDSSKLIYYWYAAYVIKKYGIKECQ